MKAVILGAMHMFEEAAKRVADKLSGQGIYVFPLAVGDYDDEAGLLEAHRERIKAIEKAGMVYVFSSDGYISKITALEIGYAIKSGKRIFASRKLEDYVFKQLIKIATPEQIIESVQQA